MKINVQALGFAVVRARVQRGELIVGYVVDLLFVAVFEATGWNSTNVLLVTIPGSLFHRAVSIGGSPGYIRSA